jgi:hypothetical protein
VFPGVPPLLLSQRIPVEPAVEARLHSLGGGIDLAGLSVKNEIEPVADLLTFALGHTEHATDDLDREKGAEVGHGVEAVRLVERGQEARDDLTHHGFEPGDGPGRKDAADQRAQAVVIRRVHHDDGAVHLYDLWIRLQG